MTSTLKDFTRPLMSLLDRLPSIAFLEMFERNQ